MNAGKHDFQVSCADQFFQLGQDLSDRKAAAPAPHVRHHTVRAEGIASILNFDMALVRPVCIRDIGRISNSEQERGAGSSARQGRSKLPGRFSHSKRLNLPGFPRMWVASLSPAIRSSFQLSIASGSHYQCVRIGAPGPPEKLPGLKSRFGRNRATVHYIDVCAVTKRHQPVAGLLQDFQKIRGFILVNLAAECFNRNG